MPRRKKEPHEYVEQEFDSLKSLVHNLLTGSKNLASQSSALPYYLREYPRTDQYVRGPLTSAEGFILERLEQSREFCSDMAKFDPEEKALLDLAQEKGLTPATILGHLSLISAALADEKLGGPLRALSRNLGIDLPDAPRDAREPTPIRKWMSGSPEAVLQDGFSNGPWPDRTNAEARMNVGEILICKASERLPMKGVTEDIPRWLGEPVTVEAYVFQEDGSFRALDVSRLEEEIRSLQVQDHEPDLSP